MPVFADEVKTLAAIATVVGLVVGLLVTVVRGKSPQRNLFVKALRNARKKRSWPLTDAEKGELRKLEMPEEEITELDREFTQKQKTTST